MRIQYSVLLAFLLSCGSVAAQNQLKVDSLKNLLKADIADTTRVNTLNAIFNEYIHVAPDTALQFAEQALETAQAVAWKKGVGSSYHCMGYAHYAMGNYSKTLEYWNKTLETKKELNDQEGVSAGFSNIGVVYWKQGDYPKALEYYLKALAMDEELGRKSGIAASLGNIGVIYSDQGDFPKALEFHFKALEINEELGDKNSIAKILGNIGNVYKNQSDYAKALEYYFSRLKLDEEIGDNREIASNHGNIGNIYAGQGDFLKALEFHFKALEMAEELGDKDGIARHLGNIGVVYKDQGDSAAKASDTGRDIAIRDSYPKALEYLLRALEKCKELGLKRSAAINLGNIGSLYIQTGKFGEAENYLDSALALCAAIGALNINRQVEHAITTLYDTTASLAFQTGNYEEAAIRYKKALEHNIKYGVAKDTLFNEEKAKDVGRLEQKHETEMAEFVRKKEDEERERQEAAAVGRRNNLQYSGILIMLVFVFAGVFMLSRFKIPQRLAEGMIFFAFLLFFEFMLVVLDPFIENYSGGEPAYQLLFNAGIAALIFPLHSLFETKLKKRLVG